MKSFITIQLLLGLFLALDVCEGESESESTSPTVFRIGFIFDGIGEPKDWNITAMTISRMAIPKEEGHENPEEERHEFQTLKSLKVWLNGMQPGEMLIYDAGCVIPSHIPVGEEKISLQDLKTICGKQEATFKVYGSW